MDIFIQQLINGITLGAVYAIERAELGIPTR